MHPFMRAFIALPVVASLVLASAVCHADDVPSPSAAAAESTPPTHVWYGYQTLSTDAVALALLIPAAANANSPAQQGFEVGSLLMYTAAAPIVHFAHGHVGKGVVVLGTSAGVIGAMTIDAALLGRETVPQDQARLASQPLVASLAPTFSVVPEAQGGSRTSFGVVGTF